MNPKSSSQENVPTTTNIKDSTPKAKESPDVKNVPVADTSTQVPTRYKTGQSSQSDIKTPQEPRTAPTEQISTPTPTVPTPTEMVMLGQPPYLIDLMEAHPAYKTFDVEYQAKVIDEYLRSDEDSREDYEEKFNNLLKKIKPVGDIYTDLEQIYDYVKLQIKIQEIIKEKEEFEQKDPKDMTAAQLKRYLNGTQ